MDHWPNFQALTFREFSFSAERYEEYVEGCLVASGQTNCFITFKQQNNDDFHQAGLIDVKIHRNSLEEEVISSFEFDTCVTMGDRLMMYISAKRSNVTDTALLLMSATLGHTREQKTYKKNEPIVGNIFTTNQQIVKVAFKLVDPVRLIEFY